MALRGQLGISYKDGSHRLYMSAIDKLFLDDQALKSFTNMTEEVGCSIKELRRMWSCLDHEAMENQQSSSASTDAERE
jgi:hypothetical protein